MGSQCSSFNKGVTWSCNAQFWANCSLWTKCFGRPYNRELQLSNLHVTKACTNALALSTDKNFLIREIFRMWKNADLQIAETWCSIFNLLSKITPMFLAKCEGSITDPSIAVKEGSWKTGSLHDPMTKSSVLSPLSLSLPSTYLGHTKYRRQSDPNSGYDQN